MTHKYLQLQRQEPKVFICKYFRQFLQRIYLPLFVHKYVHKYVRCFLRYANINVNIYGISCTAYNCGYFSENICVIFSAVLKTKKTLVCQKEKQLLGRGCRNRRFQNPGIAKKEGGPDPCQDFLVDL